ncbi:MAG TPA: anti-sigma F factor [Limnochordales bacterium]
MNRGYGPPAGDWWDRPDAFWLSCPATPANVGFARAVVAAFAARLPFTLDEIEEIKLAVSEVVSNVVLHAYDVPGGPLRLGARVVDGLLEVVVEDDGRGIEDVAQAMQPGYSRLGEEHLGIGLTVAETYMSQLDIDSSPGVGTRVRMRKRPAAAAGT